MARKKVQLRRIENDSARRATFKKRKRGLIKKVSELGALCAIPACAIIYGPYDSQPEVWPSLQVAQDIAERFRKLPVIEQSKKMLNQEDYLRQTAMKVREKLRKQQRENREYEITKIMNNYLAGNVTHGVRLDDLRDLSWLVDDKLKRVRERLEGLRRAAVPVGGCVQNDKPSTSLDAYQSVQPQPQPQPQPQLQTPTWLMEVNNPPMLHTYPSHEQYNHQQQSYNAGYFGGGDDHLVMMPYGDNSTYWTNAYFHGQF